MTEIWNGDLNSINAKSLWSVQRSFRKVPLELVSSKFEVFKVLGCNQHCWYVQEYRNVTQQGVHASFFPNPYVCCLTESRTSRFWTSRINAKCPYARPGMYIHDWLVFLVSSFASCWVNLRVCECYISAQFRHSIRWHFLLDAQLLSKEEIRKRYFSDPRIPL